MSHTTAVSDIVITDIVALRSAVERLKRNGINLELKENATPRAYYPGQSGMGQADFVVNVKDAKYDVGLYKMKEGKGYEARTDFYSGSVQKILGVEGGKNQDKLGKLYQAYSVEAAKRSAKQQGFMVSEHQNGDKVQLRLSRA